MIKNFFNVAGADAVKRIAEWIRTKFYTKTEIDDMLSAGMKYKVVEELPATGEAGTVYLVPKQSAGTGDVYDEYIYVDGSFEHIGSTEIDLSNYYTKTQADNLLDGKQASVTITTNANTPTDNDTVIMQDSGNTGTTSFLRRKLSTLWNYIKGKADGVYVPFGFITTNTDSFGGGKYLYNEILDSRLWGADERFNVTWNVYNIESGELVETKTAKNLFNMQDEYYSHPVDGEKEVITITPKDGSAATEIWTYCHGDWLLHFYSGKIPQSASLRWKNTSGYGGTWSETINFEPWRGSIWKATIPTSGAVHLNTMEITIIGKTNSEVAHPGTSLTNLAYICNRASLTSMSAVTKFEVNQELYGQLTAKKLITRGGTSSQYLRGDGSLTTLSTSPTSGSGLPITSGAVYTALNNKQNKFLTFDIPDNSGYATLTLISDITESFSTPNYVGHGIVGFMYGWRAGNLSGSTAQRITCWGNHDTSYVKLQTDNDNNNALKPLLVYYNSRYYLALKKGKRSGMTHYFIGQSSNILSTRINLYANSDESKWYSDSGRTTEVTFTITKDYSRYEGGYLNFMGNSSQVVLGTGELKTIDSSVASGSSNLVTSGAVATAIAGVDLSGKVNLQPDFTASQIDYSAGNVGKWQKVLRFPEGADLVINMKKTAMGSDATSTLWFSSSSMGDSYTSLFGNHSVRFVHDGGYVFLVLACRKSTNEPIESYTFQIAHSSVPMSDIVAVTDASPITATPKEPSIVYRAPMTTGAVSFNVTNGAGSVAMANHNDFLGNMTSEASNGVTVTMSGATEGQIYRFVFTRNITGGVTFKQSNVAYCTISGDVNAGDTITLTAVSNTADGWLYEQESAGIESSDGSNIIEYNGSTANVRVNWDKLPARVVMNVADDDYEDDKNIAIGYEASTYKLTGDANYPYAYTTKATFEKMKVDGGEEEYAHAVTAGTTYSIVRGSVTTSFTPTHSGYAVILKMPNSSDVLTTQYPAQIRTAKQLGDYAVYDKTLSGETEQYVIVLIPISANYAENIGADSSYAIVWILSQNSSYNTACGYSSRASGSSSSAFGLRARANDSSSLAAGVDSLASDRYATAAGDRARAEGRYSSAYGSTATANGEASSAIGASTNASGRYSTAIGHNATAKNYMSTAVGNGAMASGQYTEALGMSAIAGSDNSTALGSSSKSYGYCSTAVGNQTRAGLSSTDADRPYRRVKNFTAVQFTDGGDSVLAKQCETDDAVTIAVNGNSYTLTPPDEGYTLVVLNDATAQYINGIVTGYLKVDGVFGYYISNTQAVSTEVLSGNYCAVWIKTFSLPSEIASLSFVAYYTDPSSAGQYQTTLGYNSEAVGSSSVAVGHNVTATRDYQTVIGSGNLPDYDALFIIGAGGNVANAKKNILTVDYREQLQVKGVRTQVARMTTSGTISGVNNIYLIGSGCTVALPSTGEEGQVLKVCAEGNCTVGGVSLEAGKFREYVCAGGAWYTRE